VKSIAHQAGRGRHITPHSAVRTLARQTRRTLVHPGDRRHALRRHNNLERRFHRHYARGLVRPHGHRHRYPYRYGRPTTHDVRGYAVPATGQRPVRPGVAAPGVGPGPARSGQVVGGRCVCGTSAAPNPSYCRCCGQLLR
jgi:hypothetical protein